MHSDGYISGQSQILVPKRLHSINAGSVGVDQVKTGQGCLCTAGIAVFEDAFVLVLFHSDTRSEQKSKFKTFSKLYLMVEYNRSSACHCGTSPDRDVFDARNENTLRDESSEKRLVENSRSGIVPEMSGLLETSKR